MKLIASAVTAVLFALPVVAQMPSAGSTTKDPQALAQCLIQNTVETDKQGMRDFMIAALQQQKEAANQAMMAFGMNIAMKSTTTCGWTMQDLQTPQFEQAMGIYGEYMGEQIMMEAMGNMGMQ
jgi:hypothetical protein